MEQSPANGKSITIQRDGDLMKYTDCSGFHHLYVVERPQFETESQILQKLSELKKDYAISDTITMANITQLEAKKRKRKINKNKIKNKLSTAA